MASVKIRIIFMVRAYGNQRSLRNRKVPANQGLREVLTSRWKLLLNLTASISAYLGQPKKHHSWNRIAHEIISHIIKWWKNGLGNNPKYRMQPRLVWVYKDVPKYYLHCMHLVLSLVNMVWWWSVDQNTFFSPLLALQSIVALCFAAR
jgi:hypothetical protein